MSAIEVIEFDNKDGRKVRFSFRGVQDPAEGTSWEEPGDNMRAWVCQGLPEGAVFVVAESPQQAAMNLLGAVSHHKIRLVDNLELEEIPIDRPCVRIVGGPSKP